jgi:hypothetical protein
MKCKNKTTKKETKFLELNKVYPYMRREDTFEEELYGKYR